MNLQMAVPSGKENRLLQAKTEIKKKPTLMSAVKRYF
jgi:hypothetical protein